MKVEDKRNIGLRISSYREIQNLSLDQLSKKCGISSSYLGNLERGNSEYENINILFKIATALNISVDNLIQDCLIKYKCINNNVSKNNIYYLLDSLDVDGIILAYKVSKIILKYS